MKRGSKCIAQTINLSNPETCMRPKRIQKLVGTETMQPCPSPGSYWTPRPVAIKICTRKDMQRTCPPKLCDCPQKAPPKTATAKLGNAVLFLIKSTILGGVFYWTWMEGFWGDSKDADDLYYRIVSTFSDYNDQQVEPATIGEFKYHMIQGYNHALFAMMNCIVNSSTRLREKLRDILCREKQEASPNGSAVTGDQS